MSIKKIQKSLTLFALAASVGFLAPQKALAQEEVNVYSYRNPILVQPLLDEFTNKTGIKVNYLFAGKGLEQRIKAEGKSSPADVLLSTDISRLSEAKNLGITEALKDAPWDNLIPQEYKDKDNNWWGLTKRSRVIYASKDRVEDKHLSYKDLASDKFKGKLCVRSLSHPYNLGLLSAIIAHDGKEEAEKWLNGIKNNLARKPSGGDRDQAQAIYSGVCDVALGNTYYVLQMRYSIKNPEQKDWEKSIKVIFPDQNGNGSNINLSGMTLIKTAPNRDNAIKFMNFLASDEAQEIYSKQVFEYPISKNAKTSEEVKSLGKAKFDEIDLNKIIENYEDAAKMVDRLGLN